MSLAAVVAALRARDRAAPRPGAGLSVRLMKPGPGDLDLADSVVGAQLRRDRSASSRGFLPASLASTMAALVAMSPWVGSRGGSTTMRDMIGAGRQAPGRDQRDRLRATRRGRACRAKDVRGRHAFVTALRRPCRQAARLTQFRGRVKKPRVLDERVAVGHAGDEVGDAARARRRRRRRSPSAHSAGRSAGVRDVVREQIAHHVARRRP